jgi:hypothetical protein
MSALFNGTVYFVHVTFATPGGNVAFSAADMQMMVTYAQHAIVPITEFVEQQYGPTSTTISPTPIEYTATLSSSTFSDSDLRGWVNDIVSTNGLTAANSLIVVPCPTGIGAGIVGANSGYHNIANAPYAVFGVYATGLTLDDQVDQYAMVVSHEVAEAIVDPQADHSNPEVGDPCCENCLPNFYRAYFDAFNNYLGTNQMTPPGGFNFAYYTAVVVKPDGGSDCPAPDADCNYPPTLQNFYFVIEKNNFGRDEVGDTLNYPTSFYLFLEGYSPNGVAASVPSLTGSFNNTNIPGLSITLSSTTYDIGSTGANGDLPQRIRFGYDISFTAGSLGSFPSPGDQPKPFELDATIQVQGTTLSFAPKAEFFLLSGADPYFTNLKSNTGYFYLSQDLRVFTGTPGANAFPVAGAGAPKLTDSFEGAYQYIQDLVTYLNKQIGYLNLTYTPPDTNSFDPLDSLLPDQLGALDGDSSVTPKSGTFNNYNFAIARVRLKGSSGPLAAASDVKVFFRLFTTQTFDTDFIDSAAVLSTADPNITYSSVGGANPSSPLPGTDGSGHINGCSLPFFATANYDAGPSDYASGGANNQTIEIPDGHDYAWAFYGCFLNVYDLSNVIGGSNVQTWLAGSAHNCLVAQIAYSDAPIVNANGVIENPENSDKLAQRNLQVTPSGNPGFPATHRVPQTVDVRPSQPPASQDTSSILSYPDEIMIDWGNTPIGSVATLYWPAVKSASVLQLAAQFYSGHTLTAVDANTIQCQVVSKVTYIPIPSGTGGSFAGLFTLDLPASITVGNEFDIVVRRITTKQMHQAPPPPPPPSIKIARAAAPKAVVQRRLLWRYITGTFLVKIPVQKESTILPVDENLLSILKWRLGLIGPGNRWYPILLRYIHYLSQRITGMGGNPSKIPPSPSGYQPPPAGHGPEKAEHCYTGKVTSMFFDRFGDFEGFDLRTEEGEEHSFRAVEHEIEELIYLAWVERFVITVCVRTGDGHPVVSVILRRAPRALRG